LECNHLERTTFRNGKKVHNRRVQQIDEEDHRKDEKAFSSFQEFIEEDVQRNYQKNEAQSPCDGNDLYQSGVAVKRF
jgi:hypothetical protein